MYFMNKIFLLSTMLLILSSCNQFFSQSSTGSLDALVVEENIDVEKREQEWVTVNQTFSWEELKVVDAELIWTGSMGWNSGSIIEDDKEVDLNEIIQWIKDESENTEEKIVFEKWKLTPIEQEKLIQELNSIIESIRCNDGCYEEYRTTLKKILESNDLDANRKTAMDIIYILSWSDLTQAKKIRGRELLMQIIFGDKWLQDAKDNDIKPQDIPSDFETYINEELGFQISFPVWVHMDEWDQPDFDNGSHYNFYVKWTDWWHLSIDGWRMFYDDNLNDFVDGNINQLSVNWWPHTKEKITLNGEEGYKVTVTWKKGNYSMERWYFMSRDKRFVFILNITFSDSNSKMDKITQKEFSQIINSFDVIKPTKPLTEYKPKSIDISSYDNGNEVIEDIKNGKYMFNNKLEYTQWNYIFTDLSQKIQVTIPEEVLIEVREYWMQLDSFDLSFYSVKNSEKKKSALMEFQERYKNTMINKNADQSNYDPITGTLKAGNLSVYYFGYKNKSFWDEYRHYFYIIQWKNGDVYTFSINSHKEKRKKYIDWIMQSFKEIQ